MFNPDDGFTSDVIKDPNRFIGRYDLIRECIRAINKPSGLITIFGKRGSGKSSLARQIQRMALGDYVLAQKSGIRRFIPDRPRRYLTVYYQCDSSIVGAAGLASRLISDTEPEDSLIRLIPNEGKEIVEFERSKEVGGGADLKVVNWGTKGIETSKYAKTVAADPIQTLRNYISSAIQHQVKDRLNRDGLLIILDEFDVIENTDGIGSLIKAVTTDEVKFCLCGVAKDVASLVRDHQSVQRLTEDGVIPVKRMDENEIAEIFSVAERRYENKLRFDPEVVDSIAKITECYPYFAQMIGRSCIHQLNDFGSNIVNNSLFNTVLERIKSGRAISSLESMYQAAIGRSPQRQILLHLLAEQEAEQSIFSDEIGRVYLKKARKEADDFDISNVGQLIPHLVQKSNGPILEKVEEREGVYEFYNPVFRAYVKLRSI